MHDDTEPFVFPELPDHAVVALNGFLEDFYEQLGSDSIKSMVTRTIKIKAD